MGRRTKIVCTLGPASKEPGVVRQLVAAGMDVARLNFSHGSHESHAAEYATVRAEALAMGANVAVMMDLQGPKIRTGTLADGAAIPLHPGAPFTLTTDKVPGDAQCVSVTYPGLPHDVSPGDRILLADGTMELSVREVNGNQVHTEVLRGGMLGQNKGVNLPGVRIAAASLTEKDREDLAFGLSLGVDYVALSFVRSPDDVREVKDLIAQADARAGVVAKIERPEALAHFAEIAGICDAVMLARGDLGVEMPYHEVPIIQKRLIKQCNELGVPVITATQMLESMMDHARPTRAEVADVANAVIDGTDAVMLSGETAAGQYPIEACQVMARIVESLDETEANAQPLRRPNLDCEHGPGPAQAGEDDDPFARAIAMAVGEIAESLGLRQIVCFTTTGYTARVVAQHRPDAGIVAITMEESTVRRCALYWGVTAVLAPSPDSMPALVDCVERAMFEHGLAQPGEDVVIAAGLPLAVGGLTNMLRLHTLGEGHDA